MIDFRGDHGDKYNWSAHQNMAVIAGRGSSRHGKVSLIWCPTLMLCVSLTDDARWRFDFSQGELLQLGLRLWRMCQYDYWVFCRFWSISFVLGEKILNLHSGSLYPIQSMNFKASHVYDTGWRGVSRVCRLRWLPSYSWNLLFLKTCYSWDTGLRVSDIGSMTESVVRYIVTVVSVARNCSFNDISDHQKPVVRTLSVITRTS